MKMTLLTVLAASAWRIYKTEGIRSLAEQTLRYTSLYGTPDKIAKYWGHRLLGTEWVMREVQGSQMLLNLRAGGIHSDLYLYGIREPDATRHLQTILSPSTIALDIGANIGYYALQEARIAEHVYAIEPDPDNFDLLERNVNLNRYHNITTYPYAIGDRTGEMGFTHARASNWHRIARQNEAGDFKVPMLTLDDFLDHKYGRVNLVRMDVEGYECNILLGAKKLLTQSQQMKMFVEVHNTFMPQFGHTVEEFYTILAEHGFAITRSLIVSKDGPRGMIADILKDKQQRRTLLEKGLATHMFFEKVK